MHWNVKKAKIYAMVITKLPVVSLLMWVCIAPVAALAQSGPITVDVQPQHIGLAGTTRLGTWTPLCLTINNLSTTAREVRCQWILPDADGDLVFAERIATLTPERIQTRWLYAATPLAPSMQATALQKDWQIRLIDKETDELLASLPVRPNNPKGPEITCIGVIGTGALGLERYKKTWTQHEEINIIGGLDPTDMPDRWYGLSMLDAIVWTPRGTDPADSSVNPQTLVAMTQWIQRGGHLVIILPTVGNPWPDSPLKSILPAVATNSLSNQPHPSWLGGVISRTERFEVKWFEPLATLEGSKVSILKTDSDGRPLIVASSYGFGRVTMIGFDISDRRLIRMGLPQTNQLWKSVFNWQSPAETEAFILGEVKEGRYQGLNYRGDPNNLGNFIGPLVAMKETAAPALLLAILMFGIYWLCAGPIAFVTLKAKNKLHHSWLVFVFVVAGFTLIAWSGAYMMRPRLEGIRHFSVIDFDASTGLGHTRSWMSLFAPVHGVVTVDVENKSNSRIRNTIAGIGVDSASTATGFIDPQPYIVDAGKPDQLPIPMRSTSKYLEADYMSDWTDMTDPFIDRWAMPQGDLIVENGWPIGKIAHGLPGAIKDIVVVYCPGNGETAYVYKHETETWEPGDILELTMPAGGQWDLIVRDESYQVVDYWQRVWKSEGRLGILIGQGAGTRNTGSSVSSDTKQCIEMLSFFNTLPPPPYKQKPGSVAFEFGSSKQYVRKIGRSLDMSDQLALKRVIILGFMEESPIPMPLTVDGDEVESAGLTVVRWIYPLP